MSVWATDRLPGLTKVYDFRPASVVVVDFGAQYAQLIARRVREHHVYSEIVPSEITYEELLSLHPKGIILSGGPKSVNEPGAPSLDRRIFDMGVPILGICYGAQLIASELGGTVEKNLKGEYGRVELCANEHGTLLSHSPLVQNVWMSHFDAIAKAPDGFTVIASTPNSPVAAMEDPVRRIYAVQYHPEVAHTDFGEQLLGNFLFDAVGADASWTSYSIIEESLNNLRNQIGSERVICALSGGVDSSVAAALVHAAVGDQLICVFVDTGLMRSGEREAVEKTFRDQFKIQLVVVDASQKFFALLEKVTDPEEKRKIIGATFIRVFEEVALEVEGAKYLVQGTLYPDVIESGTKSAAKIKSHHNVGGLPDDMNFELVEPLRLLFKDEVRAIGEELGLPEKLVWRQPFPGPGLAVRIVGEVTPERVGILREADAIVQEEIENAGLTRSLWQSFAVLPAIKSVGVMGDERTYAYPVVLRAVTSHDAMTADWARLPYEVLESISSRVIAEVSGVNRVVYDVTSKPPGTIEWE
ncbi:MAG: glutamine-hydrolyzing GMP synthase [Acidimicrobiaceae bacterium]|nr:glutamine-hydrolyzing GMP synthase [Acidimicrobiaceae bacterium]